MQPTSEIQKLYEDEYGDFGDYEVLLNGFREHADRIEYVMRVVKGLAPQSLLDVGCNRGLFGALCNWSHQPIPRIVGVDVVPKALELARKLHGYHQTFYANVSKEFNLEEQFDLVLCMEVLEHVPDPYTTISNCLRHAKKNVIFTTPEEHGPIDGKIHVRKIPLGKLKEMIGEASISLPWRLYDNFIPSTYCEKPHWQGWNVVRVERMR